MSEPRELRADSLMEASCDVKRPWYPHRTYRRAAPHPAVLIDRGASHSVLGRTAANSNSGRLLPRGSGNLMGLGDGISWFDAGNWVGDPALFDNTTDVCIEPGVATTVSIPTSTLDVQSLLTNDSTALQLNGSVTLSGDLDLTGSVEAAGGTSTITDTTA